VNKLAKKDLLIELSQMANMSQTQCDAVLTAFAKLVAKKTLDQDTAVVLMGLGTFSPNHKEARTGRNPSTGESIQIAAKTVIKFKSHSNLVKEG